VAQTTPPSSSYNCHLDKEKEKNDSPNPFLAWPVIWEIMKCLGFDQNMRNYRVVDLANQDQTLEFQYLHLQV